MKHVFIVGSRGYHVNYGGWETFTSNLVDHYDDGTIFHVGMITDDKELKSTQPSSNVYVDPIYVKENGSIKMFIYSVKSFKFYLKYIEDNNISNAYIYVLGLKLFNYLGLLKRKIRKLGVKVIVNPDGLEWMRSKWSFPIKKFFLISERLMLKNADTIICDGLGIKKYVDEKYHNLSKRTKYIAYGFDDIDISKVDYKKVLSEFNLKKNDYLLMVGRCVPENNYEMVIKGFMNSNINKKLVIITNLSSSNYYSELKNKTCFDQDDRIIFIDGVYDKEKLCIIRKYAYLYIHGHSVGGTNPSLIEALSLTDLNVLYDVCFNKDIGLDTCLYFDSSESLTSLFNNKKSLDNSKKELGPLAKKRVYDNFTWKIIVDKYKDIFR
ncbi:MAG: DUF1972 domain-containing protein [Bacilli bacterium]|nr:DUF1972 domain-containing protein [Bacilli bacterium]